MCILTVHIQIITVKMPIIKWTYQDTYPVEKKKKRYFADLADMFGYYLFGKKRKKRWFVNICSIN